MTTVAGDSANRIVGLDAFDMVCVARRFMRIGHSAGIELPAIEEIPAQLRSSFEALQPLLAEERERETALQAELAFDVASASLAIADADPVLQVLLARAIDEQARDESMNAVEILAVGAAAALVLAVATTEFEWKGGRLRSVRKRALSDEALIRLAGLLDRLASRRGPRDLPHGPSGAIREEICADSADRTLASPGGDDAP